MGFFGTHSPKKIVVLLGHPNKNATLSSELAGIYEAAAKASGHEVKRFNLADIRFDPILHQGYKAIQELEPDLKQLQEAIVWCDHLVIVYPNWWSSMPALLKGLFDRMWLPGFAFNMRKNKQGTPTLGWHRRLKGKSARVIVLSGNHPMLVRLIFGDFSNEIRNAILRFAGFRTRMTHVGPTDRAPEWKKNEWRRKAAWLAKHAE
jgi:putative NADPH-quinone reductase